MICSQVGLFFFQSALSHFGSRQEVLLPCHMRLRYQALSCLPICSSALVSTRLLTCPSLVGLERCCSSLKVQLPCDLPLAAPLPVPAPGPVRVSPHRPRTARGRSCVLLPMFSVYSFENTSARSRQLTEHLHVPSPLLGGDPHTPPDADLAFKGLPFS